ncbi:hypothetical protein DEU56DRAFT_912581 [Suillus clintonianus]|uniref:uncharacterized protein n=1 Tax=Suillus clintonianus TaxID=1904413 RepID=UPI001B865134|nr:uncharacterized protein DEU56DRAFT_912581 [Suillus clintonianus]KAG2137942.1 hypothetical protein DEU56DRAFT_912581 [Suillus clintonianus]
MPTYPEIFYLPRALQRASTELTIFSRELSETVVIAYPVNRATGERIVSHNLKDWTRRRSVVWECFCGLLSEHRTPVRFETNRHGHAMAYCHQSPSECGFSLNLSEARETALHESVYTDVLTRVYLDHPQLMNLRDLVLRVHRDRLAATPSGHAELFPYFEGYCGTPSSALALSQQGGAVRNISSYRRRVSAANMRQQRITHFVHRRSAPLTSAPVDAPHIADELASLSLTEQEVLHSLADGKGITKYEHIGLLELCGGCQRMFAASALRAHILTCSQN